MQDDEILIPELTELRKLNAGRFSIETWLSYEGNVRLMVAYAELFWPEFVEHEGCVLLKKRFDAKNFDDWKHTAYVKNYAQIESVLNHIHILDFFGTDEQRNEVNYEQIVFLGNRLAEIYSTKLKVEFPGKKFIFDFNGDQKLEALDEYELTFYQEANLTRNPKQ